MGTFIAGAVVLVFVGLAIKTLKKDGLGCPGCKDGCSGHCSGSCCHCEQECKTKK